MIPISARLARIDFPPLELVVCVFSICVNRLPNDPPSELCKLSLCRKPLNASTNNCVAVTSVEKLASPAAAAFNIPVSNIEDAESSCPNPEILTISVLLALVVAEGSNKKVTAREPAAPIRLVCTIEDEMIGEISMNDPPSRVSAGNAPATEDALPCHHTRQEVRLQKLTFVQRAGCDSN